MMCSPIGALDGAKNSVCLLIQLVNAFAISYSFQALSISPSLSLGCTADINDVLKNRKKNTKNEDRKKWSPLTQQKTYNVCKSYTQYTQVLLKSQFLRQSPYSLQPSIRRSSAHFSTLSKHK